MNTLSPLFTPIADVKVLDTVVRRYAVILLLDTTSSATSMVLSIA